MPKTVDFHLYVHARLCMFMRGDKLEIYSHPIAREDTWTFYYILRHNYTANLYMKSK